MTLDIHAKRKLEKQERGQFYPILLAIHAILALLALAFVGSHLLNIGADLIGNILADKATVAVELAISEADVPLRNVVDAIGLFAVGFGLALIIWYGYTLWKAWTWHLSAYRNWLTVSVGMIMYPVIVQASLSLPESLPSFIPNSIHWGVLLFLALVNIVVMLLVVHSKFYPEYTRQDFLTSKGLIKLSRDLRAIRVVTQIIFAFFVFFLLNIFWTNIYTSLEANRNLPNFDFLFDPANFLINPAPEWYTSTHKYGHAFIVGVINTLQVVSVGLIMATILGVLTGIFLLSNNWLIRSITRAYVEILRNTPILVQLIFWYFVVWLIILPQFAPKFGDVENITAMPETSVMVVALRFFPYLFALMGISYYAWRYVAPPRIASGAFTAVLILELAFYFLGDSYIIIIGLAVLGAALIAASMREEIIPSAWSGFAQGIGVMALVQFIGHIMLDGLAGANIIENARVVYGEVTPFFYIGPNVVAFPRLIPTINIGLVTTSILIGLLIVSVLYIYWGRVIDRTGRDIPRIFYSILILIAFGVVAWFLVVTFPSMSISLQFSYFLRGLLIGVIVSIVLFIYWGRVMKNTGRSIPRLAYMWLTILVFMNIGLLLGMKPPISDDREIIIGEGVDIQLVAIDREIIIGEDADIQIVTIAQAKDEGLLEPEELLLFEPNPISVDLPTLNRFGTRVQRGISIAPRYMALLIGLVVYTAAFIGEIVRAGIQSVPHGQVEAARAVGLSQAQTMRMIVLPQALRVIIPPLGNQYLNLSKNSSLATAIGFADTYALGNTIMNQSGQSVTGFMVILVIYLTLSLIISLFMNFVNSRFQLVTR